MKLKDLLAMLGVGTVIHIGTENGQGWLYSDTVKNLDLGDKQEDMINRPVTSIYMHEGREKTRWCSKLLPGIAIVVAGSECGSI